MRAVILALAVLALSTDALALPKGATWDRRRVVVRDMTTDAWSGLVEQTVRDYNAVLPPRAPHLVYRRERPPDDCRKVKHRRGAIAVCSVASMGESGGATVWLRGEEITSVVIRLNDDPAHLGSSGDHQRNTLCHEFMHALTNIPDRYRRSHDRTSCVWGVLLEPGVMPTAPGPFDVEYLRRTYRGHD